jgi:hypothetical protein
MMDGLSRVIARITLDRGCSWSKKAVPAIIDLGAPHILVWNSADLMITLFQNHAGNIALPNKS